MWVCRCPWLIQRLQTGRSGTGRCREDALQIAAVDVTCPDEVVEVMAAILADE